MVGWHSQLNGHEFEQTPGVKGREAWHAAFHVGRKGSDTTWLLINSMVVNGRDELWAKRMTLGLEVLFALD